MLFFAKGTARSLASSSGISLGADWQLPHSSGTSQCWLGEVSGPVPTMEIVGEQGGFWLLGAGFVVSEVWRVNRTQQINKEVMY